LILSYSLTLRDKWIFNQNLKRLWWKSLMNSSNKTLTTGKDLSWSNSVWPNKEKETTCSSWHSLTRKLSWSKCRGRGSSREPLRWYSNWLKLSTTSLSQIHKVSFSCLWLPVCIRMQVCWQLFIHSCSLDMPFLRKPDQESGSGISSESTTRLWF